MKDDQTPLEDYPEQPEPIEADPQYGDLEPDVEAASAPPKKIKLPIGSKLKMLGGMFTVHSGGRHHVILTGLHCRKLQPGQKIDVFKAILTVKYATQKTARLDSSARTVIDSKPVR